MSKINPVDGTKQDYPAENTPFAVAVDGTNVWITNNGDDTVSKMLP